MLKHITILFIFVFGCTVCSRALAGDDPDELYRQGHFVEAEKAYASSDMDNPKDIRFRYNRGCAAYQNSDHQGAMAAFSSVLKRANDDETRFKAAYNLGNTAFKQGDFSSAVTHYKQAVLFHPDNHDVKHNLELSLRKLRQQEEEQQEDPNAQNQKGSHESEDKNEQQKGDKEGQDPDGEPPDTSSQQKPSDEQQAQNQQKKDEHGEDESERQKKAEQQDSTNKDDEQSADQQSPQDLSGELKPMEQLPDQQEDGQDTGSALPGIDRRKAEALLDNIKEDRSRFLRYQVPQDKRHGVPSGRDW